MTDGGTFRCSFPEGQLLDVRNGGANVVIWGLKFGMGEIVWGLKIRGPKWAYF